jgi:hypothetical protein
MRKYYINPTTEVVVLHVNGSILDSDFEFASNVGDEAVAKENNLFDLDDSFGDTWSDQDGGSNAFDLWGE